MGWATWPEDTGGALELRTAELGCASGLVVGMGATRDTQARSATELSSPTHSVSRSTSLSLLVTPYRKGRSSLRATTKVMRRAAPSAPVPSVISATASSAAGSAEARGSSSVRRSDADTTGVTRRGPARHNADRAPKQQETVR